MTGSAAAATHPYLDHPGPIAFAHRGGAAEGPENTLLAFERAVAGGYTYLETDARATADGVLVAFHDRSLKRVTGRPGSVDKLTYQELAAARVAGTEPIPRLTDLLDAFPAARFNIDVKADSAVEPTFELLRAGRPALLERVCVVSFSDRRLRRIRAEFGDELCTALGPREVYALRQWGRRGRPGPPPATGGRCVQIPPSLGPVRVLDAGLIEVARRGGLPIHIWTVDRPALIEELLDLGVDGIMTDRPTILRQLLAARGLWTPDLSGHA